MSKVKIFSKVLKVEEVYDIVADIIPTIEKAHSQSVNAGKTAKSIIKSIDGYSTENQVSIVKAISYAVDVLESESKTDSDSELYAYIKLVVSKLESNYGILPVVEIKNSNSAQSDQVLKAKPMTSSEINESAKKLFDDVKPKPSQSTTTKEHSSIVDSEAVDVKLFHETFAGKKQMVMAHLTTKKDILKFRIGVLFGC